MCYHLWRLALCTRGKLRCLLVLEDLSPWMICKLEITIWIICRCLRSSKWASRNLAAYRYCTRRTALMLRRSFPSNSKTWWYRSRSNQHLMLMMTKYFFKKEVPCFLSFTISTLMALKKQKILRMDKITK